MTAMRLIFARSSGSRPSFFSSTMDSCATFNASARCSGCVALIHADFRVRHQCAGGSNRPRPNAQGQHARDRGVDRCSVINPFCTVRQHRKCPSAFQSRVCMAGTSGCAWGWPAFRRRRDRSRLSPRRRRPLRAWRRIYARPRYRRSRRSRRTTRPSNPHCLRRRSVEQKRSCAARHAVERVVRAHDRRRRAPSRTAASKCGR